MIELKSVSKSYKTKYQEVQALKDINLSLRVMGESLMPIYTDGKNYFAVLTDDSIKYFPHTVIATDGRENIVPQNYNEVVGITRMIKMFPYVGIRSSK